MSPPLLQVRNLTTSLRIASNIWTVVDNLNFDLYPNKTLAIVGESGSGKSLTALSLLRILPSPPALPPTGEVLYKGRNLLALPEKEMRKIRGAKISMIFQDPFTALNPVYTIENQLTEVVNIHLDIFGDEARSLVIQALEEVGITPAKERLNCFPHQLSGGMKQRIMIAMALLCRPDILIADEPTTALDVTIQAQVLALMKDLQRKRGMAILLITHDMGVVAEMADDVIVMYAAQSVERASSEKIFQAAAHPYTRALLNAQPYLHKRGEKLSAIAGNVPSLQEMPSGCHFAPRCPFVKERCRLQDPPFFSMDKEKTDFCEALPSSSHLSKCWLHAESQI